MKPLMELVLLEAYNDLLEVTGHLGACILTRSSTPTHPNQNSPHTKAGDYVLYLNAGVKFYPCRFFQE